MSFKKNKSFKIIVCFFVWSIFCACVSNAQSMRLSSSDTVPLKSYTVRKTNQPMVIDGKLDDPAWRKAKWTNNFMDIEGLHQPIPLYNTHVKMLWDSAYLYIAAQLEEPNIWGTLTNYDEIVFRDHDFEVFIDPNNDGNQYFEIEINALGTIMDLFMFKSYKKGGPMNMGWNATGMKTAIGIDGTLNDNRDTDKGWVVEMAIPYSCLNKPGRNYLPQIGNPWRINFSRVEWTLEKSGTGYVKKLQDNGKPIPEFNWVWSAMGLVDMHVPERWGYLYFKE